MGAAWGLQGAAGLDNLLYSADADFSCFADLALTSPVDYYKEGEGSLLQCVLTPADPYMPLANEEIAARVHEQVTLSPSPSRCLTSTFTLCQNSLVKDDFSAVVGSTALAQQPVSGVQGFQRVFCRITVGIDSNPPAGLLQGFGYLDICTTFLVPVLISVDRPLVLI